MGDAGKVEPFQINGKDAKDVTFEEYLEWSETTNNGCVVFGKAHDELLHSAFPQVRLLAEELLASKEPLAGEALRKKLQPVFDLHFFVPLLFWSEFTKRVSPTREPDPKVVRWLKEIHPFVSKRIVELSRADVAQMKKSIEEQGSQPAP